MQNHATENNGIHKEVVSCKEHALDVKHTKLKKVFNSLSENFQNNSLHLGKLETVDENLLKLSNTENYENQEVISKSLKPTLEEDSIRELKQDPSKPEIYSNAIVNDYKATKQNYEKISNTYNDGTDIKDEGNHKLCEIDARYHS